MSSLLNLKVFDLRRREKFEDLKFKIDKEIKQIWSTKSREAGITSLEGLKKSLKSYIALCNQCPVDRNDEAKINSGKTHSAKRYNLFN